MAKKPAFVEKPEEIEEIEEIEETEEPAKPAPPKVKAKPVDLFEEVPEPKPREKPFNQIDFSPIYEKLDSLTTQLNKLVEGKEPKADPPAPKEEKDLIEQLGEIF